MANEKHSAPRKWLELMCKPSQEPLLGLLVGLSGSKRPALFPEGWEFVTKL